MVLATFFTLIDHVSIIFGAAVDNGVDGLSVFRRDGLTEAVDILMGISFKDLINSHGYLLPGPL